MYTAVTSAHFKFTTACIWSVLLFAYGAEQSFKPRVALLTLRTRGGKLTGCKRCLAVGDYPWNHSWKDYYAVLCKDESVVLPIDAEKIKAFLIA